jgi:outer membrane protein assembly factor BamB
MPPGGAAATTQPDSDAVTSGIIIIREADADQNNNGWALTALRTTDGKQLWSTRGDDDKNILPTIADTSFFRSPVVVGRFVYDMAVNIGPKMGGVSVVALDVATGKLAWQTPVGSIAPQSVSPMMMGRGRGGGGRQGQLQLLTTLSFNSSIAVSGRRLILTPDLGVAICLDRFDGRLDWEEPTIPTDAAGVANVRRMDASFNNLERFDGTAHVCGDVVVLAGQPESSSGSQLPVVPPVRGVSIVDGHLIWQKTNMPSDTLIGGDEKKAVFAGTSILALDGATGNVVWTAASRLGDIPGDAAITGPSVVVGDQVQVPVKGTIVALSVATGEPVTPDAKVPRMTAWLRNDATLQRMKDARAAAAFDTSTQVIAPPAPEAQPPGVPSFLEAKPIDPPALIGPKPADPAPDQQPPQP